LVALKQGKQVVEEMKEGDPLAELKQIFDRDSKQFYVDFEKYRKALQENIFTLKAEKVEQTLRQNNL